MDLVVKQIEKDAKTLLGMDAGKRFFGSIFDAAKINQVGQRSDYYQGVRDCALMIANTLRDVNPYGVAACEEAYAELQRRSEEDGREYDDGTDTTD